MKLSHSCGHDCHKRNMIAGIVPSRNILPMVASPIVQPRYIPRQQAAVNSRNSPKFKRVRMALLMLLLMFCKKVMKSIGLIFQTAPISSKLNNSCVAAAFQVSSLTFVIPGSQTKKPRGRQDCVRSPSEFLLLCTLRALTRRSLSN